MKPLSEIRRLLVTPETPLREILSKLNSLTAPVLFVVGETDGILLGSVTDGDVRRALLRGVTVDNSVARQVMHAAPITTTPEVPREQRILQMKKHEVHQLPVVDREGRLLGMMERINEVTKKSLDNTAVIMCGGLGQRMGELTRNCPKPMLEVDGKPILAQIIDRLAEVGIQRYYLAINHLGHMIEEYFGDGSSFGVEISYLRESRRCGTGGALGLLPFRPVEPLVVMNGDIFTNFNIRRLLEFHGFSNHIATMGIAEYHHQNPYGVVEHDGERFLGIQEKPVTCCYINAGIYVVSPEFLPFVPPEERSDMPDLLLKTMQAGHTVGVCPICEYWVDIGRKDDYLKVSTRIMKNPLLDGSHP